MATTPLFTFIFHSPLPPVAADALRLVTGMQIGDLDNPAEDAPGGGLLGERVLISLDRGGEHEQWIVEALAAADASIDYPLVLGVRNNLRTLLKGLDLRVKEITHPALVERERAAKGARYSLRGTVKCFMSERAYGYISTFAGDKLYFSQRAVVGTSSHLAAGQPVEYTVRIGEKRPEAGEVRPVEASPPQLDPHHRNGIAAPEPSEPHLDNGPLHFSAAVGFGLTFGSAIAVETIPQQRRNKSSR
jgi:cold shock CspA family protein